VAVDVRVHRLQGLPRSSPRREAEGPTRDADPVHVGWTVGATEGTDPAATAEMTTVHLAGELGDGAVPVTIAAGQYETTVGDLDTNLGRAIAAVDRAAELGAALLVLPEYGLSGFSFDWCRAGAPGGGTSLPDARLTRLAAHAEDRSIAVIIGELERSERGLYSSSFTLARGEVVAAYRKIQTTAAEEDCGLVAGDRRSACVTLPAIPVPVASMVCFEHGFPELALALACDGAGLLAISSEIRDGFQYLRDLRTRARAQDNGVYVVAANAVGRGNCGESLIVDPRGEVLARASSTGTDVVTAELDPELIAEQRRREPVLARRRPELYA
jgi:predicted amidohydrolase